MTRSEVFQSALTSSELKLKPKSANISGLQLADLLGHPVKEVVLKRFGHLSEDLAPFAQRLTGAIESKFNRHLYDGRLDGYGMVLFPRAQK